MIFDKFKSISQRVKEAVSRVPTAMFDQLFVLLLLAFMFSIVVQIPAYNRVTQIFPLLVSIPTVLLLLTVLTIQRTEVLERVAAKYELNRLFGMDDEITEELQENVDTDETNDVVKRRLKAIKMAVWILTYALCVFLVGLVFATVVFVIAFYRIQAKQSVKNTAILSTVVVGTIYLIFDYALNLPLYEGLLFG